MEMFTQTDVFLRLNRGIVEYHHFGGIPHFRQAHISMNHFLSITNLS